MDCPLASMTPCGFRALVAGYITYGWGRISAHDTEMFRIENLISGYFSCIQFSFEETVDILEMLFYLSLPGFVAKHTLSGLQFQSERPMVRAKQGRAVSYKHSF